MRETIIREERGENTKQHSLLFQINSIKNQAGSNQGFSLFSSLLISPNPYHYSLQSAFIQSESNNFSIQYSHETNGFRRKKCEKNEENLSLISLQFVSLPRKNFVTFSAIFQLRDHSKMGFQGRT